MKAIGCFLCLLLASSAWAGDDCQRCDRCGQACACCVTCRLAPSTKKETKTQYHTECEEFCVPGKSIRTVCFDECGKRKVVYTPTCGEVRTRKKLVKKDKSQQIPTTKCVVEHLCPACAAACGSCLAADDSQSANQMSTPIVADSSPASAGTPSAAAASASEPRAVTAAKTEFNRLLTLWRK